MRSRAPSQRDVAHRATPVTRDLHPSAAFSRDAAHAYAAAPATPCIRTKLTRSGVGSPAATNPMHGVLIPIAWRDGGKLGT